MRDIIKLGIDVELLEHTVNSLRSQLPYLHGYVKLGELDPVSTSQRDNTSPFDLLGPTRDQQTIKVLSVRLELNPNARTIVTRHIEVRIGWMRSGKWFVWFVEIGPADTGSRVRVERCEVYDNVRALLQGIDGFVPEGIGEIYPSGYISDSARSDLSDSSLALELGAGVREALWRTINRRESQLDRMRSAVEAVGGLIDLID
ncbi:MAG: hypothetical protein ABI397_01715 [Candidatus Saccharimonas sp.]